MLITRAPMRISFAGGGTDLAAYYTHYGGAVVSTSIDKYFYVILTFTDSNHIQVSSSDYRTFYRHPLDGLGSGGRRPRLVEGSARDAR